MGIKSQREYVEDYFWPDEEWIELLEQSHDELEAEKERLEEGLRLIIRAGTCDRFENMLFNGCDAFRRGEFCPTCAAEKTLRGIVLYEVDRHLEDE